MNLSALILGAYLTLMASEDKSYPVNNTNWLRFKEEHGKSYSTESEEAIRKFLYAHNENYVSKFNKQPEKSDFELKLNHLADLSHLEFKARKGFRVPQHLLGGIPMNTPKDQDYVNSLLSNISDADVPEAMDWRKVSGRVSRVKDQGQCGSCWAFSTTGVLEGQERSRRNLLRQEDDGQSLIELSEQNLVDCDKVDGGCNGGFMKDALNFIKSEHGIDDEASYPYEHKRRKCRFRQDKVAFSDTGAVILPEGDEEALKKIVATFGPVAVAIDASSMSFSFYHKGVFYNKHCGRKLDQLDHAVLVVGYGHDRKGGDYWIVKNSWGPRYGQGGYILMARNRKNNCGIATVGTIPTF